MKNTGRCAELLIPGVKVYLDKQDKPNRSTKYDLIAVDKAGALINIDSQAPNQVFGEYLRTGAYLEGLSLVKPEARFGSSRYDFYVEAGLRRVLIEVKGVTLEECGVALFPDAPTLRGVKHLRGLSAHIAEGYEAHIVFVVQMSGVLCFKPNTRMHPDFGAALSAASEAGVKVAAFECAVEPDSLSLGKAVPVQIT